MGFQAPSAERVYRYAFRLDRDPGQTLSDGFSWSILFLNDGSAACHEFLHQFGPDLCHRTADRIRFVFFSGMTQYEMKKIAEHAGRRGDFIRNVAAAVAERFGFGRRYDFEREGWQSFRPDALEPLFSWETIKREVDSAVPGSEEALAFAQRAGLGRFVPCFLMFSDVGAASVRVLPFGGLALDELHARLRWWIDSYYEVNRIALARWRSVESDIDALCRRCRSSVGQFERWLREREDEWKSLQRLSRHRQSLLSSPANLELLLEVASDSEMAWTSRQAMLPFDGPLRDLADLAAKAERLGRLTDSLVRARTECKNSDIKAALRGLLSEIQFLEGLASLQQLLQEAHTLPDVHAPVLSPEDELRAWWRHAAGCLPSRDTLNSHRSAWARLSRQGRDVQGKGEDRLAKEEYSIVRSAIWHSPIRIRAVKAVKRITDALAGHLGLDPDELEWRQNVKQYSEHLVERLKSLAVTSPAWLWDIGEDKSMSLTWSDCIPEVEHPDRIFFNQMPAAVPKIFPSLLEATAKWRQSSPTQIDIAIEKIRAETQAWIVRHAILDGDRTALCHGLRSALEAEHERLEQRVFASAKSAVHFPFPGEKIPREAATKLMSLVDEYERATSSIHLPYALDPDVMVVEPDHPLLAAAGLATQDARAPGVGEVARSNLRSAMHQLTRARVEWREKRREASGFGPASVLWMALQRSVDATRLRELLSDGASADSPKPAAAVLADHSKIADLLDKLSVRELVALDHLLTNGVQPDAVARTKRELYDAILLGIGLIPWGEDKLSRFKMTSVLRDKVARRSFDIFLAHNSNDRALVLQLGDVLRSRDILPWIDVEQVAPGRWFQEVLQSAIRRIKSAAIVVGKSGLGKWQAMELRTFMSRCVEQGIPVIPVLLPGVNAIPNELLFLRELNPVAFVRHVDEEDVLSRLAWGISGKRASPRR